MPQVMRWFPPKPSQRGWRHAHGAERVATWALLAAFLLAPRGHLPCGVVHLAQASTTQFSAWQTSSATSSRDVSELLEAHGCVVARMPADADSGALEVTSSAFDALYAALEADERTGRVALVDAAGPSAIGNVKVYVARKKDRSCLVAPPAAFYDTPEPHVFGAFTDKSSAGALWRRAGAGMVDGDVGASALLQDVNAWCGTDRELGGSLSLTGLKRAALTDEVWGSGRGADSLARGECERVDAAALSSEEFFSRFVARSRPVVLAGATRQWPAVAAGERRWTDDRLREVIGGRRVHVKVSDDGRFEGPEELSAWIDELGQEPFVPEEVLAQLQSPDLVLVRPAAVDMTFAEFLRLMHQNSTTDGVCADESSICTEEVKPPASLYIEYLNLDSDIRALHDDVERYPFAQFLRDEQRHFWFGNGQTLGKLHFDPFDNLLSPVAGGKNVTIFPPSANEQLYEGHMREGILGYDATTGAVWREELMESTSMVNSPVDLELPTELTDERFPLFASARPRGVRCSVGPGDSLFLPSFWWHEVQSSPEDGRNCAVNSWFEPFWDKEFPCAECRPTVNRAYDDILLHHVDVEL